MPQRSQVQVHSVRSMVLLPSVLGGCQPEAKSNHDMVMKGNKTVHKLPEDKQRKSNLMHTASSHDMRGRGCCCCQPAQT